MPIYDIWTDYDHHEYLAGFRSVHPSAIITQVPATRYSSSEHPDPTIIHHTYGCPHKRERDGGGIIFTQDQIPEGYVNAITAECIDHRPFHHVGYCPYEERNVIEMQYRYWLNQQGTPAIVHPEAHTRPDGIKEPRYECPMCEGKHQGTRFGHCIHALGVRLNVKETYTEPQGMQPECQDGRWGCHWGHRSVCMPYGPHWRVATFTGCVLGEYERNGYHDSDFYAVVWDEVKQSVRHIEYATTRGYCRSGVQVDYTDKIAETALAWHRTVTTSAYMWASMADAERVAPGKTVRVVKAITRAKKESNRVPEGYTGVVIEVTDGQYGQRAWVLGEDQENRNIPIDKLAVVDPENWVISLAEAAQLADQDAGYIHHTKNYRRIGYTAVPGSINAL